MELNAEQIKKSLEYWVEKYQSKYYTNHAKDALSLINSQEQKIKELTDKNEGLKAENALLLNMQVVDDYSGESMRIKINLPDPLKSSGEEYVVNRQETIKLLIQEKKQLTEENERLRAEDVIRLPLKLGDIVYAPHWGTYVKGDIMPYQITNITITQNKKGVWTKKYRAMEVLNGKTIDWQLNFAFDEIGKTVFLTKEEADQIAKEMLEGDANERI